MSRRDAGLRQVLADVEAGRLFGGPNDRPLRDALTDGGLAVYSSDSPVMGVTFGSPHAQRRLELTDVGRSELERLREYSRAYMAQLEWFVTQGPPLGCEGPENELAGPFDAREESEAWIAAHAPPKRGRAR